MAKSFQKILKKKFLVSFTGVFEGIRPRRDSNVEEGAAHGVPPLERNSGHPQDFPDDSLRFADSETARDSKIGYAVAAEDDDGHD